jgi:hypothetical protein
VERGAEDRRHQRIATREQRVHRHVGASSSAVGALSVGIILTVCGLSLKASFAAKYFNLATTASNLISPSVAISGT